MDTQEMSLKERIFNITSLMVNESHEFDDIESVGVGGRLWRPAVLLSSFLKSQCLDQYVSIENKNVLEIGAGPGAGGLVSALLPTSKVYITDRDPGVLQLITKNIEANKDKIPIEKVEVAPLDWTNSEHLSNFKGKVDVIIGSDILYSLSMVDGLVNALEFLSHKESVIIFAMAIRGVRGGEYDHFIKKLTENGNWSLEIVPEELVDVKFYNLFIVILKRNL